MLRSTLEEFHMIFATLLPIHRTDITAVAVVLVVGFARGHGASRKRLRWPLPDLLLDGTIGADPRCMYRERGYIFRDVVVGRSTGHWGLGLKNRGARGGYEDLLGSAACLSPRGIAPGSDGRPHRDGWGRRCDHRQFQLDESGQEMRVRCGDLYTACAWTWNGGVAFPSFFSLVSPTSPLPFASYFHFA